MGSWEDYKKCPECGKRTYHRKRGNYTTYVYKGKTEKKLVVPNVEWEECESCGEKLLDYEAMQVIIAAKYKWEGLFTPDEIKLIRLSLDLTQREMSKLLGVGEKTYTRWENGTYMQTRAHNEILKHIARDYRLSIEIPEDSEIIAIEKKILTKRSCMPYYRRREDYEKIFTENIQPPNFNPRLAVFAK